MNNETPNTFADISKFRVVLTITHLEEETFRRYETKLYCAIHFNNRKSAIELKGNAKIDWKSDNTPDICKEEEEEEYNRNNKVFFLATNYFEAFTNSLSNKEWEAAVAAALESPYEEVSLRGFVSPVIPGFEISASFMFYGKPYKELFNLDEDAE